MLSRLTFTGHELPNIYCRNILSNNWCLLSELNPTTQLELCLHFSCLCLAECRLWFPNRQGWRGKKWIFSPPSSLSSSESDKHVYINTQARALASLFHYYLAQCSATYCWISCVPWVSPGSAQEPGLCILLPRQGFGSAGLSKRQFVTAHPLGPTKHSPTQLEV